MRPPLLLFGAGPVALAVARLSDAERILGTTRRPERAEALRAAGIEPIVAASLSDADVETLADGAELLVTFPPDGATDRAVAPRCRAAKSIVYISSTAVYGETRGVVDDATSVAPSDERGEGRLAAEASWREVGAVVLRAPGIYGPGRGLHERIERGDYRLPGDGSNVISRIHVDDLARLTIAALERGRPRETYVVGDATPVPQIEAVRWLCDRLNLPLPESVPLDLAPPTLRGDRAVDGRRALDELDVRLEYPSYREGFAACLAERRSAIIVVERPTS